ncbi:hypothetical protein [Thalassospira aquimaris]|uniref:Uncharacterized protein n=2 Tax=Thalassospira TaxID=168934 RepID=A0ABT6G9B6_9PROT|nr:hypothetical protein [Thalassospira sp. FZY0004]MDG4718614.1 hypothetical protein [Thalassospira sp. FZY0004]
MLDPSSGYDSNPSDMLVSDAVQSRQVNWPSTDNGDGQANHTMHKAHIKAHISAGLDDGERCCDPARVSGTVSICREKIKG